MVERGKHHLNVQHIFLSSVSKCSQNMDKVKSELSKNPKKREMSSNSSKCLTPKKVKLINCSKNNLPPHNIIHRKKKKKKALDIMHVLSKIMHC